MDRRHEHRRWFEDVESFSRRVLTTVLFTDVVDSTGRLLDMGDRRWAELLTAHHVGFREVLRRFDGREVDSAGDGFLAAFDVATLAVACACAFHSQVAELGLEVRSGVHTGECELVDGRLRGAAVHLGARVAALARPGEVLVSSTVRDVVLGAELRFEDRGLHELSGLPGLRRLFTARWDEAGVGATRWVQRRAAVRVSHRRRSTGPTDVGRENDLGQQPVPR